MAGVELELVVGAEGAMTASLEEAEEEVRGEEGRGRGFSRAKVSFSQKPSEELPESC